MTNYSNKPKVVIVAPDALPIPPIRGGGIENGIWEILPHFKNYEIHVISTYNPEIDDLEPYEKVGDHHIHRIYLTKRQKDILRLRHFSFNYHFPYAYESARLINELKPDIVHVRSRLWLLPYFWKYIKCNPKMILHHHNHYFYNMRKKTVKRFLDKIDAFVGVSNFTTNIEVLDNFPEYKSKCYAVHNGIDPDKFLPRSKNKDEELLKKLNIQSTDFLFIFVGRVNADKGVHTILKAMSEITKKYDNVKLMIVGSAWFGDNKKNKYFMELESIAEPIKKNIIFTGYIDRSEIINYYHIADCYVGPSVFEDPSPNTCYESSSLELPIISSTRGGIPEIILDNETGYLVNDPEDPKELLQNMLKVLNNYRKAKEMSKKARQRMIDMFTWKHAALKTEEIYRTILID